MVATVDLSPAVAAQGHPGAAQGLRMSPCEHGTHHFGSAESSYLATTVSPRPRATLTPFFVLPGTSSPSGVLSKKPRLVAVRHQPGWEGVHALGARSEETVDGDVPQPRRCAPSACPQLHAVDTGVEGGERHPAAVGWPGARPERLQRTARPAARALPTTASAAWMNARQLHRRMPAMLISPCVVCDQKSGKGLDGTPCDQGTDSTTLARVERAAVGRDQPGDPPPPAGHVDLRDRSRLAVVRTGGSRPRQNRSTHQAE
jgi:hypothetical protein